VASLLRKSLRTALQAGEAVRPWVHAWRLRRPRP
jgi:hypothetical protein